MQKRATEQRLDLEAGSNPHQVFTIGAASSLVEFASLILGLALDGRKADIALRRSNRHVVVDVLDKDGSIRVLTSN